MDGDTSLLRALLIGMRQAYSRGENVMAFARRTIGDSASGNALAATLVAYDLQAGSYVEEAKRDPKFNHEWCEQLASIISPLTTEGNSVLEVGCGEATTLAGVLSGLGSRIGPALGLDISWSRLEVAQRWLASASVNARVVVGDLFTIPLEAQSVDIVYTSHSIEPNGGREVEAVRELLRVARKWVVLVEPAYELASRSAQARMEEHGYVRGLRAAAEGCGARIVEHRLLDVASNALNPSGLLLLEKESKAAVHDDSLRWECPLSRTRMIDRGDAFVAVQVGLVYPVLRGIPMLRPEHAIVASNFEGQTSRTGTPQHR